VFVFVALSSLAGSLVGELLVQGLTGVKFRLKMVRVWKFAVGVCRSSSGKMEGRRMT
jgi:hypothetical protein